MKTTIQKILCLCIFICTSPFSLSNDLELGIFQLNRGEFKEAIAEFEPLVADNYAPAQYQMALIYLNGYGVLKDNQKALELMTLAAEQAYPAALFDLAAIYQEGKIVPKDLKKSFTLTEQAANKGLPSAQFNLGVKYANGEGVPQNNNLAFKWYKKSANEGYALAQFNLALMYYEGKGVKKDLKMSYVWNILAARSNYIPAEKSRDMDEHKLPVDEIKSGRDLADRIYERISGKLLLEAKEAEKENRLNTY